MKGLSSCSSGTEEESAVRVIYVLKIYIVSVRTHRFGRYSTRCTVIAHKYSHCDSIVYRCRHFRVPCPRTVLDYRNKLPVGKPVS